MIVMYLYLQCHSDCWFHAAEIMHACNSQHCHMIIVFLNLQCHFDCQIHAAELVNCIL